MVIKYIFYWIWLRFIIYYESCDAKLKQIQFYFSYYYFIIIDILIFMFAHNNNKSLLFILMLYTHNLKYNSWQLDYFNFALIVWCMYKIYD